MKVIIGLGNPGAEYVGTRHNVGFEVVERVGRNYSAVWEYQKKHEVAVTKVLWGDEVVYLIKPMSFMNRSGEPVRRWVEFNKLKWGEAEFVVVQDEIDLELGRLKVQRGGGAAGHKGIVSLQEQMKGVWNWDEVVRLRCGVGKPKEIQNLKSKNQNEGNLIISNWVLGRFGKGELEAVEEMVDRGVYMISNVTSLRGDIHY